MKRSQFLATIGLSVAAFLFPRKAEATPPHVLPEAPPQPRPMPQFSIHAKVLSRAEVVERYGKPPHETLFVTCPHCQGKGFVETFHHHRVTGEYQRTDKDACYYCHMSGTPLWGDNWLCMNTKEGALAVAQAITDHEYWQNTKNTFGSLPLWLCLETIRQEFPEVGSNAVREAIYQQLESRISRDHARREIYRWTSYRTDLEASDTEPCRTCRGAGQVNTKPLRFVTDNEPPRAITCLDCGGLGHVAKY